MLKFQKVHDKNSGSYSLEGALSITIFTALFMMLISLISIIRVETVIQSAINQTAMQLSQYSYAVASVNEALAGQDMSMDGFIMEEKGTADIENEIPASIYAILSDAKRETLGYTGGAILCKTLTRSKFGLENYDEWLELQGIDDGYEGLNFTVSNVLSDGENICVSVIYKLQVNTFGLYDKALTICQRAQTRAWLPPEANEIFGFDDEGKVSSIWQETAFVRGKYFVGMLKDAEPAVAVESGYGIDLYYKSERVIAEIVSMNVFSASYSQCNDHEESLVNDPEVYIANSEYIQKQLKQYAKKFNEDIMKTERLIEMQDGSLGNFGKLNEKRLIVIVPLEAKQNESFTDCFETVSSTLMEQEGVTLVVKYLEEALL